MEIWYLIGKILIILTCLKLTALCIFLTIKAKDIQQALEAAEDNCWEAKRDLIAKQSLVFSFVSYGNKLQKAPFLLSTLIAMLKSVPQLKFISKFLSLFTQLSATVKSVRTFR